MGFGIAIMGLNGAGKTTLANCLEKISRFKCLDAEAYYFADSEAGYAYSKSAGEVNAMLLRDIEKHPFFVLSSVRLNFDDEIKKRIELAVCLTAPKDIRMARIRKRAIDKFSSRVLLGGDMYEREEAFFKMAEIRNEEMVSEAMNALFCPKLVLCGMDAPEENAKRILFEAEKYLK